METSDFGFLTFWIRKTLNLNFSKNQDPKCGGAGGPTAISRIFPFMANVYNSLCASP